MKGLTLKVLLVLGVLVVVGGVFLLAMDRNNHPGDGITSGADNSVLTGLEIRQFSERGILWQATVKRAVSGSRVSTLRAEDIRIYWPEKDLTIVASRGKLDTTDMKITLDGDVKAYRGTLKIEASVFKRDPETNRIHASGGIKVRGKGYTIKADEGYVKEDGVFEVRGNVRAVFGD